MTGKNRLRQNGAFLARVAMLLVVTGLITSPAEFSYPTLALPLQQNTTPGVWGYALQFFGNGVNDIDRVKIRIDPQTPIDVGGDFTLEWWMKATLQGNNGSANCGAEAGWITGNIIFDRDVNGRGDNGDYGISLTGGRIAFGVSRGPGGTTACGSTNVADGLWHHIAVTRNASNGQIAIYVDGVRDALETGPMGDVSYRNGRSTSSPNSDPYLVIGAEKHDAGSTFPSYRGIVEEFRISTVVRYASDFPLPSAPFTPDANTVGLYHFDEGSGATALDSATVAGAPTHGTLRVGGNPIGPVYVVSDMNQMGNGADLSVSQSEAPDPVVIGNNLIYTIIIANNGPENATGVIVTDTLPPNANFLSATALQGSCTPGGGQVSCNLGSLNAGWSTSITIVVQPTILGTITNQASAAANEPDFNPANNANSANTAIVPPPVAATPTVTPTEPPAPPVYTPLPTLTPSNVPTATDAPLPSDTPTPMNTAFLLPTATMTGTPIPPPPPIPPP